MRRAKYEILEDDGMFYGSIPELQGVWANADTLEECREELESVLEGWLLPRNLPSSPHPVDRPSRDSSAPSNPSDAAVWANQTERSHLLSSPCRIRRAICGRQAEYVGKGTLKVSLPNPHHRDVGKELLTRILRQAGIPREAGERL